jgi:hypothetical protein
MRPLLYDIIFMPDEEAHEEQLYKMYDDLSAGGSADHPLEKAFWGDNFGGLTE